MLEYTVRFRPGRYYVCPMGAGNVPIPAGSPAAPSYYAIVDEATRLSVGFAFGENQAKAICFSLDLVNARLNGDRAAEAALIRALEGVAAN